MLKRFVRPITVLSGLSLYEKERRGDPNFRFILHLLEEPSAAFDDEGTELRGIGGGGLNAFSQNQ